MNVGASSAALSVRVDLVQQFLDAREVIDPLVVDEAKLGGIPQAKALTHFATQEARRAPKRADQIAPAIHVFGALQQADVDPSRSQIARHLDARYDGASRAWVFELGRDQ
jgi:hypothetical protein